MGTDFQWSYPRVGAGYVNRNGGGGGSRKVGASSVYVVESLEGRPVYLMVAMILGAILLACYILVLRLLRPRRSRNAATDYTFEHFKYVEVADFNADQIFASVGK